ncbi:MAG: SoxY-related AACIE arm protein [Alphaproteobacteria bacterium]|nr:MAG: SoxY-related AACIE arm protein [Alphaproteobacteria bacterium]
MLKVTITRREVFKAGGAVACGAVLPLQAHALGQMETAIRRVVGEAEIRKGKVTLDLPPLVENGNTVPLTVSVDSPMTKDNYVKAIHVFNEKNPQANVISAQLSPRAGKAAISTRIRLAGTQKLMAVAEMSDGSYWSDTQEVIVTLAACLEDLI